MSDIARRFPLVPSAHTVNCCRCGQPTRVRIPVRCIPRTSGPDHVQYACPNCAPYITPGPLPGERIRPE